MNKNLSILSAIAALLLYAQGLWAVDIHRIDIEGLHQADCKGVYDQLLDLALQGGSQPTNMTFNTPEAADTAFKSCTNCCISPANDSTNFYAWEGNVEQSAAMNYALIYAFSASGTDPINGLAGLKGKRIGARLGMPYGNEIEQMGLGLNKVDTIAENIHKLQTGELDAFIAYAPDVYLEFEAQNMEPLPHTRKQPLAAHPDRMVCRGVPKGFISELNSKLNTARKQGVVRAILGKSYISPLSL